MGIYRNRQFSLSIKTDDVHEDFYENRSLFDFSDYPKDSQFFGLATKKNIKKMKDKVREEINSAFVGLKLLLLKSQHIKNMLMCYLLGFQ